MGGRVSTVKEGNATADRALSILEMFSHERRHLTALDVAAGLGVARSTAYRYLQTLVSAGYLRESAEGGFELGGKIVEIAQIAQGRNNLADLAVPEMRRIVDQSGQTVLLTKLVGTSILCLEQEDSTAQFVRLSYRRGRHMALNAGASALVCVAWLPDDDVIDLLRREPLMPISSATVTDTTEYLRRLAIIRDRGHAITQGEVDPEGMGIAVPVFDGHHHVIAGLSIVGLQSRIVAQEVPRLVGELLKSSALITAGMISYGRQQ